MNFALACHFAVGPLRYIWHLLTGFYSPTFSISPTVSLQSCSLPCEHTLSPGPLAKADWVHIFYVIYVWDPGQQFILSPLFGSIFSSLLLHTPFHYPSFLLPCLFEAYLLFHIQAKSVVGMLGGCGRRMARLGGV